MFAPRCMVARSNHDPSNKRSILVMAMWPLQTFTYGIYPIAKPPSTLHLAALFHVSVRVVSVSSWIGTRNGAESW
jgi:hypothetical protein